MMRTPRAWLPVFSATAALLCVCPPVHAQTTVHGPVTLHAATPPMSPAHAPSHGPTSPPATVDVPSTTLDVPPTAVPRGAPARPRATSVERPAPRDPGCMTSGLCWRPRTQDMTTPRGALRWWLLGALPLAALWYPPLLDGTSPAPPGVPWRTVLLHGVAPWVLALPVPLVAAVAGQVLGAPAGCLAVGTVLHILGSVAGGAAAGVLSGGTAAFFGGLAGGLVGRGVGSVLGAMLGAMVCGALVVAPVAVPLFLWQKWVAPATLVRAWDDARPSPLPVDADHVERPADTAP